MGRDDQQPLAAPASRPDATVRPDDALALLHERALVRASPPSVLINADAEIQRVSPGAGRYVSFNEGVPTRNLLSNVAPDVRVEVRAALFQADKLQRPVQAVFRRSQEGDAGGGPPLALTVHPVSAGPGSPQLFLVVFSEAADDLPRLPDGASGDDTAYSVAIRRLEDENRSLKSHLQDTLDRSAVSTEELKASNEELQAINEELRSAKEELETSKEELQSVNEELTTVNFELRMKVDEAGRNNDDLRNLMEAVDIATIFVDAGMRVKRFTPQASKLFALIPSDIGRPLMDVKSRLRYEEITEDATSVFKQLRPVERSVDSVDGEHYFARILPYRTSQDRIGGAVLTFINVTELRQAEDRVRAAEERLRDAIAANKDFAVFSTDADGDVVTWNEGATRLFGHQPADMIGRSMDLLFTGADRDAGIPRIERQESARSGRALGERAYLRADGTSVVASCVLTTLRSGSRPGFIAIARDVSSAWAREASGQHALNDAQRDRDAAKADSSARDQFLAVVSHELKQPLNLIQLNADLLMRLPEARGLPSVERISRTLAQAVATQSTIVNDLLDLSRVHTGKMQLRREPTDVAALAAQLGAAFADDAAAKGIGLVVDAPDAVVCDCDLVRMEQIIWNLLGNAVKFTDAGGHITVSVKAAEGKALLVVSDSGIGMPAADLTRVFDLYDQGHRGGLTAGTRRTGLGIGLALVRELVQAHGGTVKAASAGEGQGATFTVELALSGHAAVAKERVADTPLTQRILVVDDAADTLETLAALLRLEGAQVDATTSAQEALEMMGRGPYDLVLSDIGMPQMSGHELMRRARALPLGYRFRSIALTGYGREQDRQAARAAGFDGYLPKPVSLEQLHTLLDQLDREG